MRQIPYIGAVTYLLILVSYMSLANDSPAMDKLYFINQAVIIGLFSLGFGLSEIKKGRKAFYFALSFFQLAIAMYNIVDWNYQFTFNYYISLFLCLLVIGIFIIGLMYDRKIKG